MNSKTLKILFIFILNLCILSISAAADKLALIGKIPGEYLGLRKSTTRIGLITIEKKLITKVEKIEYRKVKSLTAQLQEEGYKVIKLKNKATGKYDVMYPGLIDLHGHNKQNVLPTWGKAKGQFANRFEWRKKVNNYQQVQSNNMNPWSSGKLAKVAAYRWSELQAMVLGTTYLQGYIQNHKDFAIHSVEDSKAYKSKRKSVSSSGDIIDPNYASFLWTDLRPVIQSLGCLGEDKCYGKAVAKYLNDHCSDLPKVVTADVYAKDSYKWLLDNETTLNENCEVENKEAFLKYFSDVFGVDQHKSFITKYNDLQGPRRSALVTHIAEGRRLDPYNWTEFKLLELGGLTISGVNLIHAVGLSKKDFKTMAKNEMGLVWSPYSNFLLYGETVDIAQAKKAGVLLALGSDWTPTGSKSVLDELKLAHKYLRQKGLGRKITVSDLYDMVTKNPAKMINHYGYEGKGEHGIGTLEVGAMGTVIVTSSLTSHPHRNLVLKATAKDINLVVIDGQPIYGNRSYVKDFGPAEQISGVVFDADISKLPKKKVNEEELGKIAAGLSLGSSDRCQFQEDKMFIQPGKSYDYKKKVGPYLEKTGLNLDSFAGIQKYLGVALLSQSHNALGKGDEEYAVKKFPALYGCDDDVYTKRLVGMVKATAGDELEDNQINRAFLRVEMGLYSEKGDKTLPHDLADVYGLSYETRSNYVESENGRNQYITDVLIAQ